MPEALAFVKKLIDTNVVDPEIMTNKGNTAQQKAFQGKAGIAFMGWTDMAKDDLINQYKTINSNAEWIQIAPPKGPNGQFDGSFDYDKPSRIMVIPKNLEKDPAKLQKVFDFLNEVSSKEGNKLVMYGLEGKHYTEQDGKLKITELLAKEGNYFYIYQVTGRPNQEYLSNKFPNQKEAIDFAVASPRIKNFDSSVVQPTGFNKADADRFAKEELVKFIYGKRPLEEYPKFLETLSSTFKYDTFLAEAEKQIKDQGLIK